jgi:hypothetical protein
MAKLNLDWEQPGLGSYDRFDKENLYSALPETFEENGKPLIVYLESSHPDDMMKTAVVRRSVFGDEKVAIGSKMFNLVKVDASRIDKTHPHWNILKGRELPRFVVTDPTGKRVGSLEGRISPSGLYGLMKKAASKTYKTSPDRLVKGFQKLLTEMDKVEAAKQALATQRATSGKISTGLQKKWDAKEAELEKQGEELAMEEKELLTLVLKNGENLVVL